MKRKIAILLSAMMVTSAMPLSASAAQLKSDSVQNTTFAKAGETIDPNAKDYTTYSTAEKLRSRQSVIKINLNDDGTDGVPAGTSFYVDLENGTFTDNIEDVANDSSFGYRNVAGGDSKVLKYSDIVDSSTGKIKTEYETLSKFYNELTTTGTTLKLDTALTSATSEEVKAVIDELTRQATTTPDSKDKVDALVTSQLSALFSAVANQNSIYPELLHIPYSVEYVSPTRIKVTTLQTLTNSDKKINVSGASISASDLEVTYYEDESCNTEFKPDGSSKNTNEIKGIKISLKADASGTGSKDLENSYIALPLGGVIADGNGAVKAKVTADYTSKVVGGEYTITKGLEGGSTTLVYDDKNVKSFEDVATLEQVVIRENVRNTIGKGTTKDEATITLRVNGGFKFVDNIADDDVTLDSPAVESESIKVTDITMNDSQNTITFKVSNLSKAADRSNPIGLAIKNLQVRATSDNNYGDVELTISGDGISSTTKVVAKREALGFKLETSADAKEMVAGRHYSQANDSMVESDNETVEVKFSESVPNTLVTSRALDFTVPEGVKITNVQISESKNLSNFDTADFEIINNGRTLRLNRKNVNGSNYDVSGDRTKVLASFKMKFNLSIDPSFTGDVKLSVAGGGQSEGTTPDVVIAKAIAPFEIKTQTTKVDLGYQDYNTADIVITETKPGMLLANETAELKLVAPYGTSEVGFSQAKFEVTGGELNVKEKDFKISNGVVSFKVDRSSYKNPSTITIKDVKIGSTRSVPFGSYNLALSGKAVLNNYAASGDKVKYEQDVKLTEASTGTTAAATGLRLQNNTEYYEVKDYVNVITETGTFNQTVKVSVGEKTVLVGDQAYDMDVAPYIQASSNSTMVPLRFVSVALGVDSSNVANPDASNKIAWDANTKTTTIYYGAGTGQKIIQFQAGSNIMVVDGTRIPMEYGVVAEIKDGRMFVPFRALGQALGVTVSWDADTRTAIYNENNARNANTTTTASTTESTTASSSSTTTESTTESTTASTDSTTETTTAANK